MEAHSQGYKADASSCNPAYLLSNGTIISLKRRKMKIRNILLVIKDQMPLRRFVRNFFVTRNAWGLFYKNGSHVASYTGQPKVMYRTKESSLKAAENMKAKTGKHFSSYKCLFCDGYHVGKNKDNK
jgi:hypothetical protein